MVGVVKPMPVLALALVLVLMLTLVPVLVLVLVYLEALKLVGALEELLVGVAMPTPELVQELVQVAMSRNLLKLVGTSAGMLMPELVLA